MPGNRAGKPTVFRGWVRPTVHKMRAGAISAQGRRGLTSGGGSGDGGMRPRPAGGSPSPRRAVSRCVEFSLRPSLFLPKRNPAGEPLEPGLVRTYRLACRVMPLVFRSMLRQGSVPLVGHSGTALGVRVPPDRHADVHPDLDGLVHPGRGGMSVAPEWRLLPPHRIPLRLQLLLPEPYAVGSGRAGKDALYIWKMGNGPFVRTEIEEGLTLAPDAPDHGSIEPSAPMPIASFQTRLAATRDAWELIPEDPSR